MNNVLLPAEWHPQRCIQLTWPHRATDWAAMLDEVETCYVSLARAIASREPLLIVTPDPAHVQQLLQDVESVTYVSCPTNDTWARDHAFITVFRDGKGHLLDFCFNGWGMKFAANLDNQINRRLFASGAVEGVYENHLDFVLEGGSIESDGKGTILTTAACLLSPNRNETLSEAAIEQRLKELFGAKQVLWLRHGYLAGDDTDSHIDTLARLCPNDTIVYVQSTDENDEHHSALRQMKEELQQFRTLSGAPFRLIPLPMADAIVEDDERLPATYANFLVMNGAVLYPTYAQPENDEKARQALATAFPDRELVPIDCRLLIKQHGSLHCATMQYPQIRLANRL